ncbi:MAG: hypothetical protein ABIJ96_03525 [Elusimicrobiota bacterium]
MGDRHPCYFCHEPLNEHDVHGSFGEVLFVDCSYCGKYEITEEAVDRISGLTAEDRAMLSAYVKKLLIQELHCPRILSSQKVASTQSKKNCIGIDAILSMFSPQSLADRLDRALLNLNYLTKHLGDKLEIRIKDHPILYAINSQEMHFILNQLHISGYIDHYKGALPCHLNLTAKGLSRIIEIQRGALGSQSKQVFVAMSFDATLYEAWEKGFSQGIKDAGYNPLRIDLKEHNEKICDRIIGEIKRSRFLVADFSMHRHGVYFEAGFSLGLGRPVIFTCKDSDLDDAHFDTRQYNHIVWKSPADLRIKLKNRIEATIIE